MPIPSLPSRIVQGLRRTVREQRLASGGPLPVERPIFMVGTVRSGSTLLARCLGEHPRVRYLGFELSEVWSEAAGVPIACPDTDDAHCPALGAEALEGRLPEGARERLHRALGEKLVLHGARPGDRLLNKNPHLSNKLELVRAMFPDAVLVVTSRDLLSTVASTQRLWRRIERDFGKRHHLPEDPSACWDCLPPLAEEGLDPRRIFPGGDLAVIADYWLRTYEAIDASLERLGETAVLVTHRELVASPGETLDRLVLETGLPPARLEPPVALETGRNDRWRELLSEDEQADLEAFVQAHRPRIEALRHADTHLDPEA